MTITKRCFIVVFLGSLSGLMFGQARSPLKLIQTIPLTGVEGRIDHLAFDVKGQRLFVAALGNNTLEVVDVAEAKRAHAITGLKEPQGIRFAPVGGEFRKYREFLSFFPLIPS